MSGLLTEEEVVIIKREQKDILRELDKVPFDDRRRELDRQYQGLQKEIERHFASVTDRRK